MGKAPSPGYRRQKRASGDLAFVELEGVRHYLGRYGSKESRTRYHRLVAEWEANGRQLPAACDELDVEELTARYLTWAVGYYRDADGNETSEPRNFRTVVRYLNNLYGDLSAASFGPRKLKTFQHWLVKRGLSRNSCNQMSCAAHLEVGRRRGIPESHHLQDIPERAILGVSRKLDLTQTESREWLSRFCEQEEVELLVINASSQSTGGTGY